MRTTLHFSLGAWRTITTLRLHYAYTTLIQSYSFSASLSLLNYCTSGIRLEICRHPLHLSSPHLHISCSSLVRSLALEEISESLKTLLLLCLGINSLEGIALGARLAVSLTDGLDVGDNFETAELATRKGLEND